VYGPCRCAGIERGANSSWAFLLFLGYSALLAAPQTESQAWFTTLKGLLSLVLMYPFSMPL
jgi:hypothetical protein